MSKFRICITADELMKRLGIGPLDLVDYVLEEKLTAYHSDKTPINLDYEQKSFYEKLEYWQEPRLCRSLGHGGQKLVLGTSLPEFNPSNGPLLEANSFYVEQL